MSLTNTKRIRISYNHDHSDDGDLYADLPTEAVLRVNTVAQLQHILPGVCARIYAVLGSHNHEAVYKNALRLECTDVGMKVVLEEAIAVEYNGHIVGSRRADMILGLPSGQKIIFELKHVAKVTNEHLRQLQYYLFHFHIATGFLINFPRDTGFPELTIDEKDVSFKYCVICGEVADAVLSPPSAKTTADGTQSKQIQIIRIDNDANNC